MLHFVYGCVHNDIKPENILVMDGKYILHDLGFAERVIQGCLLSDLKVPVDHLNGTPLYMATSKLE
jgi:serine/threonine protein kinase